MNKEIYSYHNFMFPFRFDKIIDENISDKHEFYQKYNFDKRVKIDSKLKYSLEKDNWEYQKFKVKNALDYNELVYFHDFVKDTLFNTEDFKEKATSYYFEKKLEDNASFEIKIKNKEYYNLKLEGVNLRLFDTGVGILSFEVENYEYKELDDILKINEYGRRVYPQFLGKDFSVDDVKNIFLADEIKVNGINEDFEDESKEIKLAKYILETLGDSFTVDKQALNKNFIQHIIDDRMFVMSWYANDNFSDSFKDEKYKKNYSRKKNIKKTKVDRWKTSDDWYKYVFIDGNSKNIQNYEMQKEHTVKATYPRWSEWGTLYGISRYSFVCVTNREGFGENIILPHIKTIYFQLISLLLAQRASLLRFSDEITAISDLKSDESTTQKISILYKNYLRFVNKLYFKEITAQDQGIELYDKALDILNISRDIDDLTREIATLNSYAFMLQEKEEKEEMNKITKLATLFLPPTFVAGIFGMNIFPENFVDNIGGWFIAFGGMIGLTWWIVRVNSISIKEYFKGKK